MWQVVPFGEGVGIFLLMFLFQAVANLSILHVNPGSRMDVLGGDEHPTDIGDARRCDG